MKDQNQATPPVQSHDSAKTTRPAVATKTNPPVPVEVGGPKGPEPTRYGDWEKAGRCTDF